jgi:hypothetical protein
MCNRPGTDFRVLTRSIGPNVNMSGAFSSEPLTRYDSHQYLPGKLVSLDSVCSSNPRSNYSLLHGRDHRTV